MLVFSYAPADRLVSGQIFIEGIEDTYVAFRRAIELMILNNTCRCNACTNVSSLDLKFFVHYGTFILQAVGEKRQLLGTGINLIHRLLKNTVTAEAGIRAYVLCTEAAEEALGIEEATKEMTKHRESVADLGEITVWIEDMHPVHETRRATEEVAFAPEEVEGTVETEISMPRVGIGLPQPVPVPQHPAGIRWLRGARPPGRPGRPGKHFSVLPRNQDRQSAGHGVEAFRAIRAAAATPARGTADPRSDGPPTQPRPRREPDSARPS